MERDTPGALKDYMDSVDNNSDWIHCPHCGSGDVKLKHFSPYTDMRAIVDCQNCPAKGYFN